jgi:gamma-glutamyltranspeptidase/glutathione hydrolase
LDTLAGVPRLYESISSVVVSVVALGVIGCSAASPPPPPRPCQALTADGGGVTVGSGAPDDPAVASPAVPFMRGRTVVGASTYMVVSAHPLASQAGCDVMEAGGTAADAAIAVQAVLGLVEPQATGLGGGGFLLYYDAASHTVQSYNGRETAPAAATGDYLQFIDATDPTTPVPSARASGRSIGAPGILRMLELVYRDHGHTPWNQLFEPAITLAISGFPIGGRLALAIQSTMANLTADDEATAAYFDDLHFPQRVGRPLVLPSYARTLQAVADGGADALYTGPIAQAIVDKIGATVGADGTPLTPGLTTLADLAAYQAQRSDAICTPYRAYTVCGTPPPSSGGIAVAQALGILEKFDLAAMAPPAASPEGGMPTVDGVHLISEAERLAYADRDAYVADTDFVPLPGGSPAALLDPAYLASRAALIQIDHSMGTAPAGEFGSPAGIDATPEHGTSQVTIVDAAGNALAMTSSVESTFGSFHMAAGVVLNNQLTDFSAQPSDPTGAPIANRVAGGKRPRSSMAPTLVFQRSAGLRELVLATGSPGGAAIIQYVAKALIGVLDWGLDAQQACALVNFGAENTPITNLGGENPELDVRNGGANDPLVTGLEALGHQISLLGQFSGLGTIVVRSGAAGTYYEGGADPRREGIVLGDTFKP